MVFNIITINYRCWYSASLILNISSIVLIKLPGLGLLLLFHSNTIAIRLKAQVFDIQ